ncbi:MAG: TauD/TfdA family dioxygenase, partial [Actinobacteria bacterium]|nr:TauD/TfdA family dioxygenase [Actinomycetota bacterium]NIS36891.1 TauD/TfdA family dioxygenase [Actinomycetota bacterium]NIT98966.1 TauD/TfdA family dioxygenase [Actinomycetota bacterium]NIU22611.1 TauD/TfdA family dioxygenase [Actinomycetota bacterium]NIU71372.1 TauD/TfdA family dioxygenase [Actinomycetota bacterium]
MSTLDVRPVRDDLDFGSRVAGVTRELLGDDSVRAEINDLF